MSNRTRTYDTATGKEILTLPYETPRSVGKGILAARASIKTVRANARELNRRQNYVRWIVNRTSIAGTWNPTTLYPVLFDTETFATQEYKGRKVHCVPTTSWIFTCGEPGKHAFLGNISMLISYPAVPVTMIQRVVLTMRVKSFKLGTLVYHEQSQQIADVGVAAGAPVAHYLRGWSLPIPDEIPLERGDEVEFFWYFQGAGPIAFIEEYTGHIAIEKVGDKYIDGRCCHD